MRILLVSQMYPGPRAPGLGTFVAELEAELSARGHELARAVVDRRGGTHRHFRLLLDTALRARAFRPDVVYAHFLLPAGLWAVLAGGAPVVVTAHGQDVENAHGSAAVRAGTRLVVRRAAAVVAVSRWLRDRLDAVAPEADGKTEVIDCGVDLERFRPRDRDEARRDLGIDPGGTLFLCVGTLSERKNVLALARAVERRDEGTLVLVGDGPLRPALAHRPRVVLADQQPRDRVATWIAAADVVCQPSLIEPFGLAALEGLASARSVVGTTVGGHPEFVTADAGVLATPGDDASL
ncbi:MAG: glycosyltransferase family 4 protein, partial [Actinobacteria bacterium]|nr:glycosyltransferase family 4 protein [Actinomycetota bacterium]